MHIIISPAKTLDFFSPVNTPIRTNPIFASHLAPILSELRKLSISDISTIMDLSYNLAQLNFERYHTFKLKPQAADVHPALMAFRGEVYRGLNVDTWPINEVEDAQHYLSILCGLYGILRPLDNIQPYRLEMGTPLPIGTTKNLYEYWRTKVTKELNQRVKASPGQHVLINLASTEYGKVINPKEFKYPIISPVFKERNGSEYKVIVVYTKKARGLLSRFIIQNKIEDPEHIRAFDTEGYQFSVHQSTETEWVFLR